MVELIPFAAIALLRRASFLFVTAGSTLDGSGARSSTLNAATGAGICMAGALPPNPHIDFFLEFIKLNYAGRSATSPLVSVVSYEVRLVAAPASFAPCGSDVGVHNAVAFIR